MWIKSRMPWSTLAPVHPGYDCDFTSRAFALSHGKPAPYLYKNRTLIPYHIVEDIWFGIAFIALSALPIEMKWININ